MKTFLFIVFVLLPACGILHGLRVHAFARRCVRVTASVTGHKEETRQVQLRQSGLTRSRTFRYPIIRLCTRDGALHTVTLNDERPKADRGDPAKLEVIYPEGRPDLARIAHWRARYAWPLFWFLPALWVLVFLLCVVIAYYADRAFGSAAPAATESGPASVSLFKR